MLLKLAKDKTEQLYLASFPSALPDIRKGIRVKASRVKASRSGTVFAGILNGGTDQVSWAI